MYKDKAIQTLEKFLKAWMKGNYLKMFKYSQVTWKDVHSAKDLEHLYHFRRLSGYELKAIAESGTAAFSIKIVMIVNNVSVEKDVMLISETGAMAPCLDGVWGVNPISMLC